MSLWAVNSSSFRSSAVHNGLLQQAAAEEVGLEGICAREGVGSAQDKEAGGRVEELCHEGVAVQGAVHERRSLGGRAVQGRGRVDANAVEAIKASDSGG